MRMGRLEAVAASADLVHWEKYPGNPIVGGDKSSPVLVPDGEAFRACVAEAVEVAREDYVVTIGVEPTLSEKDRDAPSLGEFDSPFVYEG